MRRSTLVLLAAVGVMAILVAIQRVSFGSDTPTLEPWSEEADRIVIERAESSLTLRRAASEESEAQWVVTENDYPANSSRVSRILEALKNIGEVELITSRENYERYELAPDQAIRVRVYRGEEVLRDLFVGKNTSVGRKSYARSADQSGVLLIDRSVRRAVDTTVADIRDKTIVDLEESAIQEIVLESASGQSVLISADPGPDTEGEKSASSGGDDAVEWRVSGNASDVGDEAVNALLRSLAPLTARSFDTESPAGEPLRTVRITMRDGQTHRIAIYPHEGEGRYAATAGSVEYPFVLAARTVDTLFLGEETFADNS